MEIQGQERTALSVPARQQIEDDLKRSRAHEEAILDEALAATFPCSDPVSSLSVDESTPSPSSPKKS
jgi:hypothetical protein